MFVGLHEFSCYTSCDIQLILIKTNGEIGWVKLHHQVRQYVDLNKKKKLGPFTPVIGETPKKHESREFVYDPVTDLLHLYLERQWSCPFRDLIKPVKFEQDPGIQ
jgi:hypothetical protein